MCYKSVTKVHTGTGSPVPSDKTRNRVLTTDGERGISVDVVFVKVLAVVECSHSIT